jgi:hypothetical protein
VIVRVGAAAGVLVLAACGGGSGTSPSTACGDCRRRDAGTDTRLGDVSVGVSLCHDGACSVAIAAADGTESHRKVHAGDPIEGWRVVSVDGSGLSIRPD